VRRRRSTKCQAVDQQGSRSEVFVWGGSACGTTKSYRALPGLFASNSGPCPHDRQFWGLLGRRGAPGAADALPDRLYRRITGGRPKIRELVHNADRVSWMETAQPGNLERCHQIPLRTRIRAEHGTLGGPIGTATSPAAGCDQPFSERWTGWSPTLRSSLGSAEVVWRPRRSC
jgi:hypothetical protein